MEFNPAFTKNELCAFLIHKGVEDDDAKKLQEEKVDGETFQDITENDLKEIGVKLGTRKKITKIIHNFKQSMIENAELQELQILGGNSNLSNSLVFDLIAAGSSCTVIPTVSSTTSLASSTSKLLPSTSKAIEKVTALKRIIPKSVPRKKSTTPSPVFSKILPKPCSSSTTHVCTEDPSGHAISTYSDPKNIKVLAMLNDHTIGKAIIDNLKTGKGISRSDISRIVRILVREMVDDLHTLYPTTAQKVNIAKAIVRDIPELKSNREGVHGYEQFYDPRNNSGSIEWRLKTLRVKLPASKRKKRSRKYNEPKVINQEEEKEPIIDSESLQKVNWLKSQPAIEIKKTDIFKAMEETFHIRKSYIIKRSPSISDILVEFPMLKEFDGDLIDIDFKLIYPNAVNMLEVLPEYSEKIIIYVFQKRQDIAERVGNVADVNLKAMMYLADLLSIPGIRKRKLKNDKLCYPSEELVTFIKENSSISQEDLTKHPRLLCCGEVYDEQLQFYLVLDKEYIDLGKCFIKAFDVLYKSFKVFGVQYPKDLAVFYSFLDTMIYKVNPGAVRSSVEHLHNIICCINTNM